MSESTSSLEREAEETRARIADTAETLRSKMTPGQMVDEVASVFRGGDGETALVNLKNQVRDNPLPLALVGAGLAWLALGKGTSVSTASLRGNEHADYRDYPARGYPAAGYETDERDYLDADLRDRDPLGSTDYPRSTYGAAGSVYRGGSSSDYEPRTSASDNGPGMMERATDAASDAWDSATGAVSDAASSIGDKLSRAGSSTADAGSRAARGAADYGSRAAHGAADYGSRAARGAADYGSRTARGTARGAKNLADSASDLFNREPLATAAVGLALGALIGALLPRTRTEDEQLGKYSDDLKDHAKSFASEGYEQAKGVAADVATETYAAAKSEADKQGLNPSHANVGDLHLADRVGSVIKSAARAGEEAARDKLGSDEDTAAKDDQASSASAGASSGTPSQATPTSGSQGGAATGASTSPTGSQPWKPSQS
ncbi:DUF3618 domain-containing protein [Tianweitania sp. BSSL-BM11]|uniref:DUF3618 domain-containing protein n=1 Tax=Tianweitania aestuarii TaxID=2814886 RepID=A0ABS5RQJ8_9HYPH|nr:DUF3618 domain-containing protein [Tianweitania aestuarii]MBS9719313.1 DUF3618 domain-containing protein [Tianweitania aestuarii]